MPVVVYSVVVVVVAELDESSADDVSQCEERIVSRSRAFLLINSRDQTQHGVIPLDKILRRLGYETRLVVVERANDIAVFFNCMTLSAVMGLRDQWQNGQLRHIVQSLFTFLLATKVTKRPLCVKRLTWPLTEYERSLEFFSWTQGEHLYVLN